MVTTEELLVDLLDIHLVIMVQVKITLLVGEVDPLMDTFLVVVDLEVTVGVVLDFLLVLVVMVVSFHMDMVVVERMVMVVVEDLVAAQADMEVLAVQAALLRKYRVRLTRNDLALLIVSIVSLAVVWPLAYSLAQLPGLRAIL